MRHGWVLLILAAVACDDPPPPRLPPIVVPPPPPKVVFDLKDGDRVALVGDGLFERDLKHNAIESTLTAAFPDRSIRFRNLGWEGDTVFGEARSYFGGPADGFARLTQQVGEFKPTVVIVAYGMNESFGGEEGLPRFQEGLAKLLAMLKAHTERIIVISPIRHEALGGALPNPDAHNEDLKLYVEELRGTGHLFVDLFAEDLPTEDGIHLTAEGYRRAARVLAREMGFREAAVPPKLAEAIRVKNELFYFRYRPQNITYILGFRKHEQGHLEREFPEYDAKVAEAEAKIALLRGRAP